MDNVFPKRNDARGEPRIASLPETSNSSAQRSSTQQKNARVEENRSESSSMFISEKVLVVPHHAVIEEADAKTNASCCPCFRSAHQGNEDVPKVVIPPEAHFRNGGSLAYRNQVVQQEKNRCALF